VNRKKYTNIVRACTTSTASKPRNSQWSLGRSGAGRRPCPNRKRKGEGSRAPARGTAAGARDARATCRRARSRASGTRAGRPAGPT
jgi:hypothetical protein